MRGSVAAIALIMSAGCDGSVDEDPCVDTVGGEHVVACEAGVEIERLDRRGSVFHSSAYTRPALAQDETHLYWSAADGEVLKTPKTGGTTEVLQGPAECVVTGMAVDDSHVYWLRGCGGRDEPRGTLLVADKTGGPAEALLDQDRTFAELLHASGHLFWLARAGEASTYLWALDLTSGDAQVIVEVPGPYLPFAVVGDSVYSRFRLERGEPSDLVEQTLDGRNRKVLAQVGSVVESMFVGDGMVHWVEAELGEEATDRSLWRLRADEGAEPERVVPDRVTEYLAVEGGEVFGVGFLEDHGAVALRLYRWSPPDYEPVAVAGALGWPDAIVVDEHDVYWIEDEAFDDEILLMRAAR